MKKFLKFLLEYSIVIAYGIVTILMEVTAACITDGAFYIKDPRYMLTVVGIICCVLCFIKNQKARLITASVLIGAHMVICIIFMLIYDMAGQWFDWSMLLLRGDAMGILENVPVNFWFAMFGILVISAWICFGLKYVDVLNAKLLSLNEEIKQEDDAKEEKKKHKKLDENKLRISLSAVMIAIFVFLNIMTGYAINGGETTDPYDQLLHSDSSSKYNQYGATNNFINEFYANTMFYDESKVSTDAIEEYIYSSVYDGSVSSTYNVGNTLSSAFGVSKGNNVVTILGETFEWMAFMGYEGTNFTNASQISLPNGLHLSNEKMRELYPNLWDFYDSSYVLTNYHAREKTDISENYSILGNYPIRSYINYNYPTNAKPYSMPNMMSIYNDALNNVSGYASSTYTSQSYSSQYFHDGYNSFYNRSESIRGLGFDTQYYSEDMEGADAPGMYDGFTDYGNTTGDRNRDDEMVNTCKDLMFPTDRQFYTYITTITMHGLYSRQRDNLANEYAKLEEYLGISMENVTDEELVLYTYMAAAMVTDAAIGEIITDLSDKGILDNTTIVLFGDHQGYYEGVSNYVKGIDSQEQCKEDGIDYMNLYRVPCMIYDTKLVNAVTSNGTNDSGRFNNKFTSSCDIVPTLLDILGIKYYENIYYGHSVFSNTPTIIYSRGYGYWLDTYSYFLNINHFLWMNLDKIREDGFITDMEAYLESYNIAYTKKSEYTDEELKDLYLIYIDAVGSELVENIRYITQMYQNDLFGDSVVYNRFVNNLKKINEWN